MREAAMTVVTCCCLAMACGGDRDDKAGHQASETAIADGGSGSACATTVQELEEFLGRLGQVREALLADPLAARRGAVTTGNSAVVVQSGAVAGGLEPVPASFTVELGAERIHVDGQKFPAYAGREEQLAEFVANRFGAVICPPTPATPATPTTPTGPPTPGAPDSPESAAASAGEPGDAGSGDAGPSHRPPRDIALVIHPDAPWSMVQRLIRAADARGASRILLGFARPSGIPVPADLGAVAALDPAAGFAACPGLADAVDALEPPDPRRPVTSTSSPERAVAQALAGCQCKVPAGPLRALAFARSGLVERRGQIPVVFAVPFIDPGAGPDRRRTVIAAAPDAPWSVAHTAVLEAITRPTTGEGSRAFIAATEGGPALDPALLVTETDRGGPGYCARLAARRAAEEREARRRETRSRRHGDDSRTWSGTGEYGLSLAPGVRSPFPATTDDAGQETSAVATLALLDTVRVEIGEASIVGPLDKEIIRRYVRRQLGSLKLCYARKLAIEPGLEGSVVATFQIAAEGFVLEARARGVHPDLAACVSTVLERVMFPGPRDGGLVQVSYPFRFAPH